MLDLKLQGKRPIYEQLFTQLSQQIMCGNIAQGEKLPTVRDVAKQLGINPNTVQKSYAMLEQAGFINSVPAKGSYACMSQNGAQEFKNEALQRLELAMENAQKDGIKKTQALKLVNKVWGDNND